MKALKIDPKEQTITEVEFDGTPVGLARFFPYKTMQQAEINNFGDYVMFNGEGLEDKNAVPDGAWGVYCPDCSDIHSFVGVAYIYGNISEEEQVLNDPHITLTQAVEVVEWGTIRNKKEKEEEAMLNLLKLLQVLEELSTLTRKPAPDEGEDSHIIH